MFTSYVKDDPDCDYNPQQYTVSDWLNPDNSSI